MITRPKLRALVVHLQDPALDGEVLGADAVRNFDGGLFHVQHADRMPRLKSATVEALLRDEIAEAPQATVVPA